MNKSSIIKDLKKSNQFMVAVVTDKETIGFGVEGDGPSLMAMIATIVKNLHEKGFPKDLIEEAVKVGFMSEKEIKEHEEDIMKELEKLIKGGKNEQDNS